MDFEWASNAAFLDALILSKEFFGPYYHLLEIFEAKCTQNGFKKGKTAFKMFLRFDFGIISALAFSDFSYKKKL
jgi:hypothetical protein